MEGVGDRIIAITSPRVTTEDAANGQIQALDGPVLLKGLHRILRACRRIATRRWRQRRYEPLIEANGEYE